MNSVKVEEETGIKTGDRIIWRRVKLKNSANLDRFLSLAREKKLSREELILVVSTVELKQNIFPQGYLE